MWPKKRYVTNHSATSNLLSLAHTPMPTSASFLTAPLHTKNAATAHEVQILVLACTIRAIVSVLSRVKCTEEPTLQEWQG